MANQTIGVNLKFSADVSAAKRAMAELQGSLAQIHNAAATSANPGIRYAKDLNQASQAAAQLRIQLQNAFNQDTGKLNLTKFNMEMKQAGMSVEKYRAALTSIGPQGQQAFTQLAHSVAMAETNTISLSAGIQRLGATFMNTLRYQLSSTVIMGFVQGISEAVTYVKDLNASLNDIRIVTNYGVDEMKEFANYANKAAKALSTTTNEYAKASLIYFQQGLTDEEVQKRTDLTIKMANVTGQAVGEVSDQLTSVWNNFDNGTKSLEHYVNVMVALGAATASSSEEISEGLNKFAAVAETVGLSYEYAAAALATVTATTRQSADIVGTAFKTLFARIQDLELGKELDDGTTLGQYSQALAAVGINIKDVNGEVKDMNSILDEMGAKWNTLSKDSQIALAQNVAGVRQYTQLIALMDNWDFFKQNLETANASTGALQEQADIYAESWEAASQRVTASLETIYNKLLNDEFFIKATNLLADFIGLVENLVDGLGGMPGVLALVGVALTRVFSTQMAQGINNMAYNLQSMTKAGRAKNTQLQQEFLTAATKEYGTAGAKGQEGAIVRSELNTQSIYIKNKTKMNELERQIFETRMSEIDLQKKELQGEINQTKELETQAALQQKLSKQSMDSVALSKKRIGAFNKNTIDAAFVDSNGQSIDNKYLEKDRYIYTPDKSGAQVGYAVMKQGMTQQAYTDLQQSTAAAQINQQALSFGDEDTFASLREGSSLGAEQTLKAIDELKSRLQGLGVTAEAVEQQMQDTVGADLSQDYQTLAITVNDAEKEIAELIAKSDGSAQAQAKLDKAMKQHTETIRTAQQALDQHAREMSENSQEALELAGATKQSIQATRDNGVAIGNNQTKIMQLNQQYDGLGKNINKSTLKVLDFGTAMQQGATIISTVAMMFTSLIGVLKTLSDEEIDPSEKITTVLTTLGFMLPMVIGLFNEQNKSLFLTIGYSLAAAGGQKALAERTEITSFAMLKGTAIAKGFGKALGKFAIYAAAIAVVVLAVTTLAKAADDARNSAENFAASATQGAKDAAEAYSQATTAFNELKDSISSYEEALNGLQKLTEGTNEYKQALFDANEQALALVQSHAGLKYYIDSNGLIVFDEGELDRIEAEAQQKKADAYSAKLSADRSAREAAIENQKIQLGRQLNGYDAEWNDEDDAAALTGLSVGLAGAAAGGFAGFKIGTAIGTAAAPGWGTLIGAVAGVLLGAIVGTVGVLSGNDATEQEVNAIEALMDAYKEQGDAALTKEGIRDALNKVGIDDEDLVNELSRNKEATKELLQAVEANTAAIEAETLIAATQQAHALDATLQYRNSEAQSAITKALARERTNAEKTSTVDPNSYRSKQLFGAWYNVAGDGKEDFKAYLREQGLGDQVNKIYDESNFSDDHIEYEYIDENGDTQKKKLTYAQLAAWRTAKNIDEVSNKSYDNIVAAINSAQEFFGDNSEGLLSVIGGQDLISLSEQEFKDFKSAFNTGEYNEYIRNNWAALGYESADAFKRAISESIANYDPEKAFAQFSQQINSEIDGILQAGAEGTEYTTGALESYTEALAENNEALHDNANEWKNLEKKKFAAQAAVANAKFVKGVDALTEVLEDNLEILMKWDEASLDTYEAADKVQTALEDVFGLRVSADFVKKNLKEIQELAQGNTENLEEMSHAAAVDFALNIDTMSEEAKGNFVAMINQLADIAADGIEIGTNIEDINDGDYIAQLNKMLEAGEITAEQIQQAFGALGYSPDIKFKTVTQTTKTTHRIYDNPEKPEEFKTVISETDSEVQVPYIAGENTQEPAAEDGSDSGQENGKGITKIRDVGSIGASLSDTKKENQDKLKTIERYHEIKEELADIERSLNKIAKAKDRAFGKAKLDLIDQEIKQQEQLIKAEEEYQRQLQVYYKKDLAALDSRFKLDENGRIKNYTAVLQSLRTSVDDKTYEKIKESADQYEETLNELEAQQEKVNDEILKLQDLSLEKIEYEVEINVHFNDREIKRLEHLLKNLEDPAQDAAEAIALLGRTAERNLKNVETYMKGIKDVLGESFTEEQSDAFENLLKNIPLEEEDLSNALRDILGENTQITDKQKTALENYIDSLYEASDAMDEFYDQIVEKINAAFDDMNEKSEKASNRVEQLGSTLETYQNIIDLVGKKSLGITNEQIRALGQAQVAQAKANLELKQGQLEMNQAALVAAQTQRTMAEEAGDIEAIKHWDEQIEIIQESVWELESEVESAWGETLQVIADDFANAVETSTSAFEEAMTGIYGSYDKLQEVFNQQKEIGDRFVDDYQKIYDLNKLNRDLTNSIDDTDSIKGKQALRDLQKEINKLQESDTELSQHDLDFLRKKYELRLAEIALEEAQNAKSQVRMRRDSEGNWSYVYTADEEKTASAQQNFEDKLYEIQQLEQNYIDEMQDRVIQAEIDMIEAINSLRAEDFATQEEYQAEVTRITEYYTGMRNYALDELNKAIDNSKFIYQSDWKEYSEKTGYKISLEENWRDSFEETELSMVTGYQNISDYRDVFESNTTSMINNLTKAFTDWELDVKETFRLVKQDFENFGGPNGTLDKSVKNITGKLNEVSEKFKNWKSDATTGFQGITQAAAEQFTAFSTEIAKYKSKITDVINALTRMLELAGVEIPAPEQPEQKPDGVQSGGQGGDGSENPTTPDPNSGGTDKYYGIYYTPNGTQRRTSGSAYVTQDEAKKAAETEATNYIQRLVDQDKYRSAMGEKTSGYENYTTQDISSKAKEMIAKGITTSTETDPQIEKTINSDFQDYGQTIAITTTSGNKVYLTAGHYTISKGKEVGTYSLMKKSSTNTYSNYTIDKNTLNQIITAFGNSGLEKSGSGDLLIDDPPYDKNDLVQITDTLKIYGNDLISQMGTALGGDGWRYTDYYWKKGDQLKLPEDFNKIKDNQYYNMGTQNLGLYWGTTSAYVRGSDLKRVIPMFDTGGYTGEWDSSGRLAMLHQKEIVLNAHDTENFLQAINIVRDIASMIDLRAAAQQSALAMMATATTAMPMTQTLEQKVTIHAEFPNATERTEIEAAFDTLLNRASQFANRKNK